MTTLPGVGPRVGQKLHRLGIEDLQDLLFHLPLRYQDRTRIWPISLLRIGDEALVEAEISHCEIISRHRRMLLVTIADGSGTLILRFFHFNSAQQKMLQAGTRVRCFSEIRKGPLSLEMVHPEINTVADHVPSDVESRLTPVYPTTEGLHQNQLRKLADHALNWLSQAENRLSEWLPEQYLKDSLRYGLNEAIAYIHHPPPDADVGLLEEVRHPAQQRLAFEELLAQQLSLIRLRAKVRTQPARLLRPSRTLFPNLAASLPFTLTKAQQRVITQIGKDLASTTPMQRLVQGDVGSGKTIVAAAACLQAIEQGYQAAIMAPTELLAEQHFRSFSQWLVPLELTVSWLSGKQKTKQRRKTVEGLSSGATSLVIGTHALFQEDVSFTRLALVIVDEQHRFGVHQRLALREKGFADGHCPHQLIMTATPIPRTLAMTAYADLDYSVIDELPPGRIPVKTVALSNARRSEVISRVRKACEQDRQAYWVCTLIEESEVLQCQTAEDTAALLARELPHLGVALIHGRMPAREKEDIMLRFKSGEIQLLVATTVIEVGVDVPNASLMIIENAERLGLAQLHQLRGRVGRGTVESSCVLLFQSPLSETARHRLQAMRETTDGFEIAKMDLKLRGPGEVLGTRQTGMLHFRIADLVRDQRLIPLVQKTAKKLFAEQPQNVDFLIRRWIGNSEQYGQV
ncbi:MAG: ATP-dependent DNA helicase RecG [Gammaproteobacteria bacterium]|nr:ATP-dependent DNA helicase RecG [Gammaproteobacteria bacterium]